MINLMKRGLPQHISVGGEPFQVYTDFRVWMRFCNQFEKWDRVGELDVSYLFIDRVPLIKTESDVESILEFAYPPAVVPKSSGGDTDRILDYEIDADYIYSAFLGQYGIDLTEEDMHWHKFHALLRGLNSSTRLYEIMGYRSYEGKDKDYQKLRNLWQLPMVVTEADKQAKQEFDDYFG